MSLRKACVKRILSSTLPGQSALTSWSESAAPLRWWTHANLPFCHARGTDGRGMGLQGNLGTVGVRVREGVRVLGDVGWRAVQHQGCSGTFFMGRGADQLAILRSYSRTSTVEKAFAAPASDEAAHEKKNTARPIRWASRATIHDMGRGDVSMGENSERSSVKEKLPAKRYIKHTDLKLEKDVKVLARRIMQEGNRMGRERIAQGLAQLDRLWASIKEEGEKKEAREAAALLFKRVKQEASGMRPKQLCLVLSAHAKINGKDFDHKFVRQIEQSAQAVMDSFNGHNVAWLLQSYTSLGWQPSVEALEAVFAHLHVSARELSAQDVANVLRAFECMKAAPAEDLLALLQARAVLCATEWTPRLVWVIISSLDKMSAEPSSQLLDELGTRLMDGTLDLKPQDVSAYWVVASRFRLSPGESLIEALRHKAMGCSAELDAQGVSNTLMALARIGYGSRDRHLVEALSMRGADIVHMFKGYEMSAAIWALAKMGLGEMSLGGFGEDHKHDAVERLFAALCWRMAGDPKILDAQAVGNFLWAYAQQQVRPLNLDMSAMLHRAAVLAPDMTPQCVANVLWSLAKLRLGKQTALVSRLCNRAVVILDASEPFGVLQIVWAFGKLGMQPKGDMLAALNRQIMLHVQDFDLPSAMETLTAFTRMRIHPGEEVIEALKARARLLIQRERDQNDSPDLE